MAIYRGFDHYSFASSWIAFPAANVGPEAEGAESHVEIKEATGETEIGWTQTACLFERGELVMTLRVCRKSLLLPRS